MANNEHLFMYLFDMNICISSLVKCLSFHHSLNVFGRGLFICYCWVLTALYIFLSHLMLTLGLPQRLRGKEAACQCRRHRFYPWKILEDPLQKEMATHSSILAWRIPWSESSSGLQIRIWLNDQTTKIGEKHGGSIEGNKSSPWGMQVPALAPLLVDLEPEEFSGYLIKPAYFLL